MKKKKRFTLRVLSQNENNSPIEIVIAEHCYCMDGMYIFSNDFPFDVKSFYNDKIMIIDPTVTVSLYPIRFTIIRSIEDIS